MDTRSLMWIILGVILLVGGIASSLKEGKRGPSRPPRAVVAQPQSPIPSAPSQEKKFDTGFSIDPIKGLKRKDENIEYFK